MGAASQSLLVALIVGACAVYALWKLVPSAARRHFANAALRLPLPPLLAPLRRAMQAANACGCDGCDVVARKPDAGAAQPLRFHPRRRG